MAVIVNDLASVTNHLNEYRAETNQADAFLDVSISNSPRKTFVSGDPTALKQVRSTLTLVQRLAQIEEEGEQSSHLDE